MIPQSFIQQLLDRLDIIDVVEQHIKLKKAGSNYVACCPFHNEKSPSFTVSPSKQFYHCFGCGAHGTAINFVMEHTGLGFVDAVHELAHSAGLQIPQQSAEHPSSPPIAPSLFDTLTTAMQYYRNQLKQHPPAIDYLKQRGLTGQIAARYGIGYAPAGWRNLTSAVADYLDDNLTETGLVIQTDEDKRYDRFRDRIMFPIANNRGQIIGFGGRVLGQGEPKYLNSPETPLFEKGRELYGLYQAQKSIRQQQQALVVEGYMDVVALAQHGVDYAVATLGTATTPFHIQRLFKLTEHIIFCFDGDKAGRKAAWRALENALPQLQDGKRISFLFLPSEHDPDSYIREHGQEDFEEQLHEAMPLSGYLLQHISQNIDLRTPEGRDQLVQRSKPLLSAIKAPTTSLLLRKEIARLSGLEAHELDSLLGISATPSPGMHAAPTSQHPGDHSPPPYSAPPMGNKRRPSGKKVARRIPPSAHKLLLQCLLAKPPFCAQIPEQWQEQGQEAAAIMSILQLQRANNFSLSSAAITQTLQDSAHQPILAQAEAEMLDWGEDFDINGEFEGILRKIQDGLRKQKFMQLQEKARGGIGKLSEEERLQYLQLLQRTP